MNLDPLKPNSELSTRSIRRISRAAFVLSVAFGLAALAATIISWPLVPITLTIPGFLGVSALASAAFGVWCNKKYKDASKQAERARGPEQKSNTSQTRRTPSPPQ